MRLRIKGNSLCFRLIRSELATLITTGRIEKTINFSLDGTSQFAYVLMREDSSGVPELQYKTGELLIALPIHQIEELFLTDRTEIYAEIGLGACGTLELVIEKDFSGLESKRILYKDQRALVTKASMASFSTLMSRHRQSPGSTISK